jgi:hypothetical protein
MKRRGEEVFERYARLLWPVMTARASSHRCDDAEEKWGATGEQVFESLVNSAAPSSAATICYSAGNASRTTLPTPLGTALCGLRRQCSAAPQSGYYEGEGESPTKRNNEQVTLTQSTGRQTKPERWKLLTLSIFVRVGRDPTESESGLSRVR